MSKKKASNSLNYFINYTWRKDKTLKQYLERETGNNFQNFKKWRIAK